MSTTPPNDFDQLIRHYEIYRDYMKHEDDLLNHRATWHLVMQGLLFTAIGVLLQWKYEGHVIDELHLLRESLIFIIPVLGILIASLAYGGAWAAHTAIETLSSDWERVEKSYTTPPLPLLPGVAGAGNDHAKKWGKNPSRGIPMLIGLAWLVILILACSGKPYEFRSNEQAKSSASPQSPLNNEDHVSPSAAKSYDQEEILKEINASLHHVEELEAKLRDCGIASPSVSPSRRTHKLGHLRSLPAQ
jgi:hypothetical protein